MMKINESDCRNAVNLHPELKPIWGTMNYTNNFGTLTYLYKKYNSPSTYQDFLSAYIQDSGNTTITGRSEEYILEQANRFSWSDYNRLPKTTYINYILQKLIIDTLDGQKWEVKAKDFLEDLGYKVLEPSYIQDSKEGIDKLIYKDGKLTGIIQIKPLSFFRGNQNYRLIEDRKLALQKERLCVSKYGVPVYFMIYDKNGNNWITTNGKLAHSITSLISHTGQTNNLI